MKLTLVIPNESHEKAFQRYIAQWEECGEEMIPASAKTTKPYREWLVENQRFHKQETCPENLVPATTLFILGENGEMVGIVDIRHTLYVGGKPHEGLMAFGGNIGYGIAPAFRRKGYMTQALMQSLDYCRDELGLDKVLITCKKTNIPSAKTIQKCGGVLEDERENAEGIVYQRYWITL